MNLFRSLRNWLTGREASVRKSKQARCQSTRLCIEQLEDRTLMSGDLAFALGVGGIGVDVGRSLAKDSLGNVYVAGSFQDTVDFDPGLGDASRTSAGGSDAFVAKYDSTGIFQWVRVLGGAGDDVANGIAVDSSGYVSLVGSFTESADWVDNWVLNVQSTGGAGDQDGFIFRIDSTGYLWSYQTFGGMGADQANAVTMDDDGNSYFTGSYTESATIGWASLNASGGAGDQDGFAAMWSNGMIFWAQSFGGMGADQGNAITWHENSNDVYLAGSFTDSAFFGPSFVFTNGSTDGFVARMDASFGAFEWGQSFGGFDADHGTGIAVDSSGNAYVTGSFTGSCNFNWAFLLTSSGGAGDQDGLVAKIDSTGNYVWAKSFGGTSADQGNAVALDDNDNVFVTGYFTDFADMDPGYFGFPMHQLSGAGDRDSFVAIWDSAGTYGWGWSSGGPGVDEGNAIILGGSHDIYVTGSFEGTADFEPSWDWVALDSAGQSDVFLQVLKPLAVDLSLPGSSDLPVDSITIAFSAPVWNFGLFSLELTRDGGSNLLTFDQTLTTNDDKIWTLGNLGGLTNVAGVYRLVLNPLGIQDNITWNELHLGDTLTWTSSSDLVGTLFELSSSTAVVGDSLDITYSVKNQGGADTQIPVNVYFYLSDDNFITMGDTLLAIRTTDPLAASASFMESFSFTVPFATLGAKYVGMIVDADGAVSESNETNNSNGAVHGNDWESLTILAAASENAVPNDTTALAQLVSLDSRLTGSLPSALDVDYYRIMIPGPGRLTARLDAGFATRLSLVDQTGNLLIQSDGVSPADPNPFIEQHLNFLAGMNYFLKVESIKGGSGAYQLTTQFMPESGPTTPGALTADLNGDGILDLVTANPWGNAITILLGMGDGTFQTARDIAMSQPSAIEAGDFNGDGRADLAVANWNWLSGTVTMLIGNGDGTFWSAGAFAAGSAMSDLTVGDFNLDGRLDVVTANSNGNSLTLMLGNGDGTLQSAGTWYVGSSAPRSPSTADFNNDGWLDLILVNSGENNVTVLMNQRNGSFSLGTFFVGDLATALTIGDFNGDGWIDFATSGSNAVSVRLNNRDGTFAWGGVHDVGSYYHPDLTTGDFNGDGRLDLAVADYYASSITLLLGNGDGSFALTGNFSAGVFPSKVMAGDYNGDGWLDLAVNSFSSTGTVTILRGNGEGAFQEVSDISVDAFPQDMVFGDFNGDGRYDLVTSNQYTVSVLLNNGDGTFQDAFNFSVGIGVSANAITLTTEDFNGDGRLDLAVSTISFNKIVVLLGNGDGTFQRTADLIATDAPTALTTGDYNGDGRIDLVSGSSGSVRLRLGNGDGTFQNAGDLGVGGARDLTTTDLDGDGWLDLIVTTTLQTRLLLGNGDGTFQAPSLLCTGTILLDVAVGDFDRNGSTDVAVVDSGASVVKVVLANGDGTFRMPSNVPMLTLPGSSLRDLAVGDFNGDGTLDLAVTVASASTLSENYVNMLFGNGLGGFSNAGDFRFFVGNYPSAVVASDFNSDGRLDLATSNINSNNVSLLLGTGNGFFFSSSSLANFTEAKPLSGDLTGDGTTDMVVLRNDGRMLFRKGIPGQPGVFEAPVLVNAEDFPVRDLTQLRRNGRVEIAALEVKNSIVSFHAFDAATGNFTRTQGPTVPGLLLARIAAADLDGNGRDDFVVTAAGSDKVSFYLQSATGSFGPAPTFQHTVGASPFDIAFLDMNADQRLDIVTTNQFSGDVSILLNAAVNPFATELRFRAGAGPFGMGRLVEAAANTTVKSQETTSAVAAGDFNSDTILDLVALNKGSGTASILLGDGTGGVFNPTTELTFAAGADPTEVVATRFNQNSSTPGLAILDRSSGTIRIYAGDGAGGFTLTASLDAGNVPTGLSTSDVNNDGKLDLLVGNEYGDILFFLGNGDGTFQSFTRANRNVPFVARDLNGDNVPDVLLANQSLDQALAQIRQVGTTTFSLGSFSQDGDNGLIGPGFVTLADLDRDGLDDFIVANSGSNNVLVYLGTGPGQFRTTAQTFFAGTNPVFINVSDLNGDGAPDLAVANQGSNDVTILLGSGQRATWTLKSGPRLDAGGVGPNSIDVRDQTGDGILDLIVTNGQSGTATLLPGRGTGFFNDTNPAATNIGGPVRQTVTDTQGNLLFLRNSGAIFSFNPTSFSNASRLIFNPSPDRFVTALNTMFNSTSLVVGRSDRSLSVLNEQANGQFAEALVFRDASLNETSALEVIGNEIYVTNEGSSVPLVIGMASFIVPVLPGSINIINPSFFITLLEGGASRGQFAQLNPLEGSNLAFVATLLTGGENDNGEGFVETESESNFVATGDDRNQLPGRLNLLALFAGVQSGWEEGSEEEEEEEEVTNGEAWKAFVIGIDEALQEHMNQDVDERLNLGPDMPSADVFEIAMAQWLQEHRGSSAVTANVVGEMSASGLKIEEDYRWIDPRHDAVALSLARALVESMASNALVVLPGMLGSVEESSSVPPPCVERPRRDLDWTSVFAAALVGCSAWRVKSNDREEDYVDE